MLLGTLSPSDDVLRNIQLTSFFVRDIVLQLVLSYFLVGLLVLGLLDLLVDAFVLVEILAIALETCLDLLVDVLDFFDYYLLEAVELVLHVLFNF